MARWPEAVDLALWPYALRYAVHLYNTVPVLEDGVSRLELFAGTQVGKRMRDHHTFACPVFALQNSLAAGNSLPRWSQRVRLGINLSPSPFHAQNVYLILNLTTGLVSPQYHCRFDDFFETTHHNKPDILTSATWKQLAGLKRPDGSPTAPEPSRAIQETLIPQNDRVITAPNEPLEFVQDFEPMDDTNILAETPADPVQDSEGASVTNDVLPSTGTSSRGRQRKMSRAMAESVSQRDFYGNKDIVNICAHTMHLFAREFPTCALFCAYFLIM
jgi:hypothetical protein